MSLNGFCVFNHEIGTGVHDALVSIVEHDEVRRSAVDSSYLEDLAPTIRPLHRLAANDNPISYCGVHCTHLLRAKLRGHRMRHKGVPADVFWAESNPG